MLTKGLCFLLAIVLFSACGQQTTTTIADATAGKKDKLQKKTAPNDHFFMQRSYPDTVFPLGAYNAALQVALADYARAKGASGQRNGNPLVWENEGPGNIGGRINTIAIHPTNPNTIYVGAACGGVFKTTNGGTTWLPIFDDQPYLAIGDITLDPNNPNTVYVGTGDPNVSGYPFIGDGVYKSTDAGQTWTNIGLADQRIVSRIEVHPMNSNLVYVATMGLPFQKNNERGLYKSTDGGQNWQQVFFEADSAGVIDLLIHPTDTNIIYLTGWNRIRNNAVSMLTGPEGQIYKSIDAGQTWQPIMNGIPNVGNLCRINLEMSGSDPNLLFASVIGEDLELQGIYKTTNGGTSWSALLNNGLPTDVVKGFGWYFGHIKVNPTNNNEMFFLGVDLYRSTNGGNTWTMAGPEWWTYQFHADKHDLVFYGNNIYCATDGGLYSSYDDGDTWQDIENIPNTQFYHVALNPHVPGRYYGGAQDNGTSGGNQQSFNNWNRIYGGDGFDIQFHPTDDDIFYAETQNGGIVVTTNGGATFRDAVDGIDENDRRNWDMPYKLSYFNPTVLYAGTYRMYKSTVGSRPNWVPVSQDLTKGNIWDGRNTISVIEESRLTAGYVFCGTSDGNVWRSDNNGNSWTPIQTGLPNRYVTDLESSHLTPGLMAVSHSGYKDNDFIPHIHLSRNNGDTWTDISGDLPPLAINDVEISSLNDSLIFVATDGGVYYTTNQGVHWDRLGTNMPVMLVYDIEVDDLNSRLIAGTHARSMMSIPIDSIIGNIYIPPVTVQVYGGDTICKFGSTTINAIGGTSISWSPTNGLGCSTCHSTTASPTSTTTYYATVTNGITTATDSVTVVVAPTPNQPLVQTYVDSLVVSNPDVLALQYQWYLNNAPIPGANQLSYVAQESGSYYIAASNGDCGSTSTPIFITIISAPTLANTEAPALWGYSSWVYARSPLGQVPHTFELYNMAGQLVVKEHFTTAYQKDINYLGSGHYVARIITHEGIVAKKLFVE